MKLAEAVRIAKQPQPEGAEPFGVFLACGCSPLHLETFLLAELRLRYPARAIEVKTGLFDDCLGNLLRATREGVSAVALVIEWSDLDPRLGLRRLGGWTPGIHPELIENTRASLNRLRSAIETVAGSIPIAVCPPTLALPPVSLATPLRAAGLDLQLRSEVARFLAALSTDGVRILDVERLPLAPNFERRDVRMELAAGFPYTISHAASIAAGLAHVLRPPAPKKGLITDLDGTLWSGILGEVGASNVSWDLAGRAQIHGLYQQALASLAESGVLIAIATRNERALVEEALLRDDLKLPRKLIFPVEAGWGRKSEAVSRILQLWNIGAADVVVVDDSPMELAEIQAVHPEIDCRLFATSNPATVYALMDSLRTGFGDGAVSPEDHFRRKSLEQDAALTATLEDSPGEFLRSLDGEIRIDFSRDAADRRAFELVNKTNQFNLNGRRYEEGEWHRLRNRKDGFTAVVSYQDRFGPLGRIAVLAGRVSGEVAYVQVVVLSCRAFSRRIEHHAIHALFEVLGVGAVSFEFAPTPRNAPFRLFLKSLGLEPTAGATLLSRAALAAAWGGPIYSVTVEGVQIIPMEVSN